MQQGIFIQGQLSKGLEVSTGITSTTNFYHALKVDDDSFRLTNAGIGLGFILGRFLPGVGLYLANALAQLISAKLSRTDEYAADAYAAALLKKSNIGTEPQVSLLNKLDYLVNSNELPQIPWLMSHPSSKDRISEIAKLEKKWTKNIP